jgi:hypothetical protein
MSSQASPIILYAREAPSDVLSHKLLAEFGDQINAFELDYPLLANAALAQLDSFLSSISFPNSVQWQAGTYAVSITVVGAVSISLTVQLWRCDTNGNRIAQIGATPALQTAAGADEVAPVTLTFDVVNPANIVANQNDRLELALLAQNNDSVNPQTLEILASRSGVETEIIPLAQMTNSQNPFRRGKFLGYMFRPGQRAGYFDKNGVDLETNKY